MIGVLLKCVPNEKQFPPPPTTISFLYSSNQWAVKLCNRGIGCNGENCVGNYRECVDQQEIRSLIRGCLLTVRWYVELDSVFKSNLVKIDWLGWVWPTPPISISVWLPTHSPAMECLSMYWDEEKVQFHRMYIFYVVNIIQVLHYKLSVIIILQLSTVYWPRKKQQFNR